MSLEPAPQDHAWTPPTMEPLTDTGSRADEADIPVDNVGSGT